MDKDELTLSDYVEIYQKLVTYSLDRNNSAVYKYDLYAAAAVSKAISNIKAFNALLAVEPLGIFPFVRIHLDTLLRLNAPSMVEDFDNLYDQLVDNGTRLDKLVMRDAFAKNEQITDKRLTDANLIKVLKNHDDRIEDIYQTYCEDIHFSGKAIKRSIVTSSESLEPQINVLLESTDMNLEMEIEQAKRDMLHISDLIAQSLAAFITFKEGK